MAFNSRKATPNSNLNRDSTQLRVITASGFIGELLCSYPISSAKVWPLRIDIFERHSASKPWCCYSC
ncbi:unnamed protein product, partial [Linum tenue]